MAGIAGAALEGAIRNEFLDTYKGEYERMEEELKDMARLAVPSQRLQEKYVYFESIDHPKRQDRDDEMSFGDYQPKSFTVANHRWAKGVKIHEDDVADDQTTGGFIEKARQYGEGFALIPERVFYQLLLSTTDQDLLPAVPNAPDGVPMFYATDSGGGDRFGVTGGNLVSGGGVTNAALIRTDFWKAFARYAQFKDSKKKQPLIHPSKLTSFSIWFNVANIEVFREAFKGLLTFKTMTSPGNLAVTISNSIGEAPITIKLCPTQRITTNDWFMRCTSLRHYSLFEQSRSPLKEVRGDDSNSDSARVTGYDYMGWKQRSGFGLGLPYDWTQIDN